MSKFYNSTDEREPNIVGGFHLMPFIDAAKSQEDGTTIYSKQLVCEIKPTGKSKDTDVIPVTDANKKDLIARFPKAWDDYENGGNEKGCVEKDNTEALEDAKRDLTNSRTAETKAKNKLENTQSELEKALAEIKQLKAAKTGK